jgi:hypothetical protein
MADLVPTYSDLASVYDSPQGEPALARAHAQEGDDRADVRPSPRSVQADVAQRYKDIAATFEKTFGSPPDVLARAPGELELGGAWKCMMTPPLPCMNAWGLTGCMCSLHAGRVNLIGEHIDYSGELRRGEVRQHTWFSSHHISRPPFFSFLPYAQAMACCPWRFSRLACMDPQHPGTRQSHQNRRSLLQKLETDANANVPAPVLWEGSRLLLRLPPNAASDPGAGHHRGHQAGRHLA